MFVGVLTLDEDNHRTLLHLDPTVGTIEAHKTHFRQDKVEQEPLETIECKEAQGFADLDMTEDMRKVVENAVCIKES